MADINENNGWSLLRATVNGEDVEIGSSFRDEVMRVAQSNHYNNFRVFLNGSEIGVAVAPQTIAAGMTIEVRPYDKAG